MLRKLQQRSTFSCTDRTREEEGNEGRERKKRWQSSTGGREEELLIRLRNVLLRFQNPVCVCVFQNESRQCVRSHTQNRSQTEMKVHNLELLCHRCLQTWLSSRTLTSLCSRTKTNLGSMLQNFKKGKKRQPGSKPSRSFRPKFCLYVLEHSGLYRRSHDYSRSLFKTTQERNSCSSSKTEGRAGEL